MKAIYRAFLGHVNERPLDCIDEKGRYKTSFTLFNDTPYALNYGGYGLVSDRSAEVESVQVEAFGKTAMMCVLNMLPGQRFIVEGRFKNNTFTASKISYA